MGIEGRVGKFDEREMNSKNVRLFSCFFHVFQPPPFWTVRGHVVTWFFRSPPQFLHSSFNAKLVKHSWNSKMVVSDLLQTILPRIPFTDCKLCQMRN